MDRSGVTRSVVASIATKPSQFEPIRGWSRAIASTRIIPFPSVHPDDPDAVEHIRLLASDGFQGVKLHPYYQRFVVDDDRMEPLYRAMEEARLALLLHCGFDPAFPRDRIVDPARIVRVARAFPRLPLIATHIGAWEDWDEVERHLIGHPIYVDTAHSLQFMPHERGRELLSAHPTAYILFGSDSPWSDQLEALAEIRALEMGCEWERAVLGGNAARLLALSPCSGPDPAGDSQQPS